MRSGSSRFLLLTNTFTNVFLKGNYKKTYSFKSFCFSDSVFMVLFNHLHFAFNDKKPKRWGRSKSGPVCNFCLFFSCLSEPFIFHLPFFLIFPLWGKETESSPSATPCPEAIWQSNNPILLLSKFATWTPLQPLQGSGLPPGISYLFHVL